MNGSIDKTLLSELKLNIFIKNGCMKLNLKLTKREIRNVPKKNGTMKLIL